MKYLDITLPLRPGMIAFPGDPVFAMEPVSSLAAGDACNLARLTMASHGGTHVDPPAHYLPGAPTVEALELERLIGPATVLDLRGGRRIDRASLQRAGFTGQKRVLLKTDNGPLLDADVFRDDYACLELDGARFLVEAGVWLVGVDYLSVEDHADGGSPVHELLLGAGVIIVECLRLGQAPAGDYELLCLPLLITGADGAPARVVLRRP